MPKQVQDLIRLARKESGLSQEAAAPMLFLGLKQLKNMEAGKAYVDPATIGRMAQLYQKPMLANQYVNAMAAAAGMGLALPEARKPLPSAVVALISRIYAFSDRHRDRDLLRIAEDGVIDETERPDYDAILTELQEIIRAAQELRYCVETG